MNRNTITIGKRKIGDNHPTFIIAEMSANHNRNLTIAMKIIKEAKIAGADVVKLQTYVCAPFYSKELM